jgi:endonuclease VIII
VLPEARDGHSGAMPEGHLLHHHARVHRTGLTGPLAVTSPQERFVDEAARLDGQALTRVEAHGKHLLHVFAGDEVVHVHLGMRGLFLHHPVPPPPARPQVRLRMVGGALAVDLIAPLTCELLDSRGRAALLDGLGPDPLHDDADAAAVRRRFAATRTAVGALLLDQSVVAGVGNVLRAEVLYLAGVHPATPAAALDDATFARLWRTLVAVMRRAAEEGRIITVEAPAGADRSAVDQADGRFVYKQDRCRRCGAPVERLTLGGRQAYVCPREQPAPP